MRRRRVLLGAGALALLGVAGLVVAPHLLPPPCYPTQEKCERIKLGMPVGEALDILGPAIPSCVVYSHGTASFFEFPDGSVLLADDMHQRVTACEFTPNRPPSLWDRLRRWLPW